MSQTNYLGYLKYEGRLVADGLMDARKQAKALLALDSALRHFVIQQVPDMAGVEFEIPVRVRQGSWEALIPESAAGWLQAGAGIVATAYFTTAANKMAEKDFKNVGFTDVFRKSLEAIKWFAKIGNHVGDLTIRSFANVRFTDDNALVALPNASGEYMYVPVNMLEFYTSSNPKLLESLVENVEDGRELVIGTFTKSGSDEVTIGTNEKGIYCPDSTPEADILLPELIDGQNVVLEGEVTHENKTSNSMGFLYRGNVVTAYPVSGSIVPYKPLLFLKCRLYGTVSRRDNKGGSSAKRPKLFFSRIEPLEQETGDLFGG